MSYLRTTLLLAVMTALLMGVGALMRGLSGAIIAFFLALALNLWGYWNSDKSVLRMTHAHALREQDNPQLYNT